jgi:hypothetical protein
MAEAISSDELSSSQSDEDCPPESARTPSAVHVSQSGVDSKANDPFLKNRISIRKFGPLGSQSDIKLKKPWGWGSASRGNANLSAHALPATPRSSSKKCYGAPDLSSPRNDRESKSLEDLQKLTLFPIVS